MRMFHLMILNNVSGDCLEAVFIVKIHMPYALIIAVNNNYGNVFFLRRINNPARNLMAFDFLIHDYDAVKFIVRHDIKNIGFRRINIFFPVYIGVYRKNQKRTIMLLQAFIQFLDKTENLRIVYSRCA